MDVVVLLTLTPQSGRLDDLVALLSHQLPQTRVHPGCRTITAAVDTQAAAPTVVVVEQWESVGAHRAYVQWRSDQGHLDDLLALLAQPPSLRRLEVLAV
jgi:quinol monooxygenase YgiN